MCKLMSLKNVTGMRQKISDIFHLVSMLFTIRVVNKKVHANSQKTMHLNELVYDSALKSTRGLPIVGINVYVQSRLMLGR